MVQIITQTTVKGSTPRVDRLREELLSIKPTASIERARIETRVLRSTEGESVITRRAKVFAATVREMPIYIYPNQLIAGCTSVRPLCTNVTPAINLQALKVGQSYILGVRNDAPFPDLIDNDRKEWEELKPY